MSYCETCLNKYTWNCPRLTYEEDDEYYSHCPLHSDICAEDKADFEYEDKESF